ncbi:hypothetical protein JQ604_15265 [Bradyrhizobium jicamae]|uniref:hypothetical protein n=1 Tax=Bradyrhizobium jicamae TaxID=280332 RepID=UPI001BACFF5B|nr:hypothetical protein [Bradyrhizobium jicamae]MBR0753547.1 hypothetical protein [Bradyrhizobium jicamae]
MRPNKFAKLIAMPALCLLAAGCEPEAPTPNADVAAQVGDTVTLLYSLVTPMCSDRTDAGAVYLAYEIAMRQSLRLEGSAMKAVGAAKDAQKAAMVKAYSCEWGPAKGEYVVRRKEIMGDEKEPLYHTAEYCLKPKLPEGQDCWWIVSAATRGALIKRVDPQQAAK